MQQTTQGVWLSCSKAKRIFIMDLEGSDSLERGDDRKVPLIIIIPDLRADNGSAGSGLLRSHVHQYVGAGR